MGGGAMGDRLTKCDICVWHLWRLFGYGVSMPYRVQKMLGGD